ncbi:unnamed protein product [Tetraodon nigroviridis]|uniref:(spotted green pufferfish) hypothetical protein n=1 Tax=Tetraodon nigroviridis TaxID=99883 RepID=Q4SVI2_TETNG|nr:unnamed protein product [Tetraodon nigroviridis]
MRRGHRWAPTWLITAIIGGALAAAPVPPPTDVDVTCQNQKVQVRWNYSRADLHSRFTVTLKGNHRKDLAKGFVELSTVEHRYDLTQHIWSSEDWYMSTFWVTVTATVGGKQSEPALSRTFTFNNVETAAMTCRLDFPPAELVRTDVGAKLRFSNPFHFYRELKQAAKPDPATFSVEITSDYGNEAFSCSVKEETCKRDLVIPEGANDCITLDGILFAGNLVDQILFRKSEHICAVAAAKNPVVIIGADELVSSAYDFPHLLVDMGEGDMVTAYRD